MKKIFTRLEIVVGIYRLLTFDFKKFSQKWNFGALSKSLNENFSLKGENSDLVKWFTIEIYTLLLQLSPNKKLNMQKIYFSLKEIEDLSLK